MNKLNILKGILIGIAKIIPGFSGSVLMISFGLYDKAIDAITCFFSHPKKNFLFLLELGIGIFIGIVLFSRIVSFFLQNYYLYTCSLFIGLMLGGILVVVKNISVSKLNILLMVISFLFVVGLSFLKVNFSYDIHYNFFTFFLFFLSGVLEAFGTVIPGVSSTALLMLIGVYSYYLYSISHVLSFSMLKKNLFFFIPFSLGMFLGVIFISILVQYLFSHYKEQTFSSIFGFSIGSIFLLFIGLFCYYLNIYSVIFSIVFLGIGFGISRLL